MGSQSYGPEEPYEEEEQPRPSEPIFSQDTVEVEPAMRAAQASGANSKGSKGSKKGSRRSSRL